MFSINKTRIVIDDFHIHLFEDELFISSVNFQGNYKIEDLYIVSNDEEISVFCDNTFLFTICKPLIYSSQTKNGWAPSSQTTNAKSHIRITRDDFAKAKKWLYKLFPIIDNEQ